MINNFPFVSIIIPCRNEEKYIGKCLDSIISQDYPKDKMEVLIIDGMSEDGTRNILEEYSQKASFLKILNNPKKYTPFGLNIGIREAKGEIIIRMDAHAGYEKDYILKCVKYLKEYNTDNVGGIIKTLPAKNTLIAKAITISLSHFLGAASTFRLGSREPKLVDTVFGGCYKKEVFEKIGFFNENLIRSQDLEFNLRLKRAGGRIFLFPDIVVYYYPSSNFKEFLKHNFSDGFWITYPLKFGIKAFSFRHLIPLAFVLGLIIILLFSLISKSFFVLFIFIISFYVFLNFVFSFQISIEEKDLRYLFLMPSAFICRHFGYGLGSVIGLFKIIF